MNTARSDSPVLPESLAREVLRVELKCRHCHYNLQTLAVGGKCPECGLEIWQTIIREFDPEVSRLPRLSSPRWAGNGIALLLIVVIAIVSLLMAPALVEQLRLWQLMGPNRLQFLATPLVPFVIALLCISGQVPILMLHSTKLRTTPRIGRRSVFFMQTGMIVCALINLMQAYFFSELALIDLQRLIILALGALFFWGLQGVLTVIGEHSRSYRHAQGGRQGLEAMIAALGGIALGTLLQTWAGALAPRGGNLATIGMVISWISSAMLYLGLIYLFMNSCWIRNAIIRPSRSLDELLGKPLPVDEGPEPTPSE